MLIYALYQTHLFTYATPFQNYSLSRTIVFVCLTKKLCIDGVSKFVFMFGFEITRTSGVERFWIHDEQGCKTIVFVCLTKKLLYPLCKPICFYAWIWNNTSGVERFELMINNDRANIEWNDSYPLFV